jgi:heptosyltransferase-1
LRILLVRLRLIGDVVFTTPLIAALRRAYPDARIAYLVEPAAAAIVLGNPHLDEVIVAPKRRGVRRILDDIGLARRLRRANYDLVLDLHGGPRSAWLALATGAKERIGYDIKGRAWMYTRIAPRAKDLRPRHSVENQWDLLEAIPGWPGGKPERSRDRIEIALDRDADARMGERLARAGFAPGDELIVLHVSAGNPFRRWPEASFAETAAAVAGGNPRRRIVFSSGPSDREAASRIAADTRKRLGTAADRLIDLGEFDLQELRALIGRSRLFVGGDTGPLHVAAATDTPVVGIYGPTQAVRSAPWRPASVATLSVERDDLSCRPCDQRVCVHEDFRCLTGLPPSAVIAAAEQALLGRTT